MCGIAGYFTLTSDPAHHSTDLAARMSDAILHRGPDTGGQWCDPALGLGLAMRRLAIVDLSPAGSQPMTSACGRYVMVFNGEIYNHRELRATLEVEGRAPRWCGHSDTEVLLAAIATFGLVTALRRANGMFALAVWDKTTGTLQLAVDRFGEKPLYYGWQGRTFLFGSELKALRVHPAWRDEIDRDALALYFRHSYVPAPHSIFAGIAKVEPGFTVCVRPNLGPGRLEHEAYWSSHDVVANARGAALKLDERESLERFEQLFDDAVALRMEADVPLGAFLSGGFDSTAVVASMQRRSRRPVKTFTIGFTEEGYDEAPFAKAVASHLGTEHTELYVTPQQAMDVVPGLPHIYDEPFADSSQIPTLLVSKLARKYVTVSLSGDGADELFGGYRRYFVSQSLQPALAAMPQAAKAALAAAIRAVGPRRIDAAYRLFLKIRGRQASGERAAKLVSILAASSSQDAYRQLVSAWRDPLELVRGAVEARTVLTDPTQLVAGLDAVEHMMLMDLLSYLPGDILTKVDRATMAVSLEGRVPFLDHRLMEFAWQLPLRQKVRGGQGKRLVRRYVNKFIPPQLMDRPKSGFGVPIGEWLRGPLRGWASDIFASLAVGCPELIDAKPIDDAWSAHLSQRENNEVKLWTALMFEAWREYWVALPKVSQRGAAFSPSVA